MARNSKQISNPFSTGDGGGQFEAHIATYFVVLMLSNGFVPCLPCLPIQKIKLQGRYKGYETDDMIVFLDDSGNKNNPKLFCQSKHSINITDSDKVFEDVIQAAWNDFNNPNLFTKNKDAIALITGPLCTTDINDTRFILEWAHNSENAEDYVEKVNCANFSSNVKRNKLQAFKTNLTKANDGTPISDETLFEFLKHFNMLGFDLDIESGITLSLLYSLIGQYTHDNAQNLYARLNHIVQTARQNAHIISRDDLPDDLQNIFRQPSHKSIPNDFLIRNVQHDVQDWNQYQYASQLAIAVLIGGWNENNESDKEVISQLINIDYDTWIKNIRELLHEKNSPVTLKNGWWSIKDRKQIWNAIGARLYDDNLDKFKQCVINVLNQRDPQFELSVDDRFSAAIYGKVLPHTPLLRKSLAEGLALLGNLPNALTKCSQNKAETIAVLSIREIFENSDWKLWGSLNGLLPILAESAPNEFLEAVEKALRQSLCPFDELFSQEGNGITGGNYLTGLLWALETLAWDEQYIVRACVILGELATHDPGGNWTNRPDNSLTDILRPWTRHTEATFEKRKTVIITLQREVPEIAWELLLSLLPNQHQISTGTHKPTYRKQIHESFEQEVSIEDYWEQVTYYAECVVNMAINNFNKLHEIIDYLDKLPETSFDEVLKYLAAIEITSITDDERQKLWYNLTDFIMKHRRFPDAEWTLNEDIVTRIEDIANKYAPNNPLELHSRLFNELDYDLYEEGDNWQENEKKVIELRIHAIIEILNINGIDSIIQFAESVKHPWSVGFSLGNIDEYKYDLYILPNLLETNNNKLANFTGGYVLSKHKIKGWDWVDGLDISSWSINQLAQFLVYLPFTNETWKRVEKWLGVPEKKIWLKYIKASVRFFKPNWFSEFENEYWQKVNVRSYDSGEYLNIAVDKLIEYERPFAAIDCLYRNLRNKKALDISRCIKALLAVVYSKEQIHSLDTHHIIEIIKALQNDPKTDPNDLFRVEWANLRLLDRHHGASPKILENRLASDPTFFCEVIRCIYRSEKEDQPIPEPSEQAKAIASNAWNLLYKWQTPPGTQLDGGFSQEKFKQWLDQVKKECDESGHIDIALNEVGKVLFYSPSDSQGLWIDRVVAEALNEKDAENMRNGYRTEVFNSRGAHHVDPTGKPERKLANKYRKMADEIENAGYQRFAVTLRILAETYDREAERIIEEHRKVDDEID